MSTSLLHGVQHQLCLHEKDFEKFVTGDPWAAGHGQTSGELGRGHVHSQGHAGLCLVEDMDGDFSGPGPRWPAVQIHYQLHRACGLV